MVIITNELIESGISDHGGYSTAQLKCFGLDSFDKNWKRSIIGKEFSDDVVFSFLSLKNSHLKNGHRLNKNGRTVNKKHSKGKIKRRQKYSQYINSKKWKDFKKMLFSLRGHKCERCGIENVPIHGHHKTYDRIFKERPEDIILLCETCHKLEHSK